MLFPSRRLSLRKSPDFFDLAHRSYHQLFTCWYIFEPTLSEPFQAAVVVGKKVSPLAVDRNKLKRRTLQILQHLEAPIGLKTVLVMKHAALEVPTDSLTTAVSSVLQKIKHEKNHA